MIKYGGDAMVDAITKLFQIIYHFEVVPRDWKLGSICPIFKEGDKQDLGNYRSITLLSVVGKLMERILNARLSKWLEKGDRLYDVLGGFCPGSLP